MSSTLQKITSLLELLRRLESKRSISWEDFESDWETYEVVENLLRKSIETCLDIGEQLIARYNLGDAKTYRQVFQILGQAGLIESVRLDEFLNLAGFRNVVVHAYDDVDPEIIFDILKNHLEAFRYFVERVKDFLKQKGAL